jgi:hypothetical protein
MIRLFITCCGGLKHFTWNSLVLGQIVQAIVDNGNANYKNILSHQ